MSNGSDLNTNDGMYSSEPSNNINSLLSMTDLRSAPGTVYCPTYLHAPEVDVMVLPTFEVKRDEVGKYVVSIEKPVKGSSIRGPFSLDVENLSTFLHDFTFRCFSLHTNRPLSVITKMADSDDKKTPDEIIDCGDRYLVLEYATRRTPISHSSARNLFMDKRSKYLEPLKLRSKKRGIDFFVIISTPSQVISNLDRIPQFWVKEIALRHQFAKEVLNRMEAQFSLKPVDDERTSSDLRSARAKLNRIPMKLSSGVFTKEEVSGFTHSHYDIEFVQDNLKKIWASSNSQYDKENIPLIGKPVKEYENKLSDLKLKLASYEKDLIQSTSLGRTDIKRVIQMPILALRQGSVLGELLDEGTNYPSLSSCSTGVTSASLFYKAFREAEATASHYNSSHEKEVRLACMPDKEREEIERENKELRRKRNRVSFELEPGEELALAKVGLNAKKFERILRDRLEDYRLEKKKTFSMEVFTEDLDEFIYDEKMFYSEETSMDIRIEALNELINTAYSVTGIDISHTSLYVDFLRSYRQSRLGRAMKLMSDIGDELCVSLKQHCRPREWILKRVTGTRLYLIIHPTKSSSHIFYAMCWPKEDELYHEDSTAVRYGFEHDGWVFTDVISTNKSKLVNMVSAEAKVLSCAIMAAEHTRLQIVKRPTMMFDKSHPKKYRERVTMARRFLKVCLLSLLHDKGFVDEAMSEARYVCMQGFTSFPMVLDPTRRLSEIKPIIRSRMHAWVYKKLFLGAGSLLETRGYRVKVFEESTFKKRAWFGMRDVFTGDILQEPQQLINTFYYNYLHNKDEDPEKNSSYKIMNKILEWEDKFPKANTFLGVNDRRDPTEYETMEFSPSLIRYCCEVAIKKNFPNRPNWKDELDDEIMENLLKLDFERLSTLKASAYFSNLEDEEWKSRPRVMESLKKFLDGRSSPAEGPLDVVEECLQSLHENPGLMVDTFPKAQHGGFREILVLDIKSRMVQVVIETVARTICSKFGSEMMTHPKRKLKAPQVHSGTAKRVFGSSTTLTVCSNDDAKKWNQGHVVSKFMILLCQFTHPHFHNLIISGLDLWLRKNIRIPQDFLALIDTLTEHKLNERPFYSDACTQLARCRVLGEERRWMKPGSHFVTTSSGFLQGILHYTSSLFHTVVQEASSLLFQSYFRAALGPKDGDLLVTAMQSSDDSSFILTTSISDRADFLVKYTRACQCFYFKYELAKAMGIYNSSKSVCGTINILEFNSEFFDHGNLVRPTNKWVFACNTIPESGSLFRRQEHFKNLNTAILEGGGSFVLAAICQLSQCLLHYRMMGSSFGPGFLEFVKLIKSLRDPSLGFFMLDDPRICGLGTLKYNLYQTLRNSMYLSRKYKTLLERNLEMKLEIKSHSTETEKRLMQEILTTGSISSSSLIIYGEKTKWNHLVENLNLPENWMNIVDDNPEILYRRAENMNEFALKLAVKAHDPGVVESLGTGSCAVKVLSSSVYLLTRSILSLRDFYDRGGCKTSILRLLIEELEREEWDNLLTEEDYSILFPLYESYERLNSIRMKIDMKFSVDIRPRKRCKNTVVVFESPESDNISLEKILRSKWFQHNTNLSSGLVTRKYEEFQKILPWLRDDPEETLKNSPFLNQLQLKNFLSKLEIRERCVHLTCNPVSGRKGEAVLETVIFKNQWPGYRIDPITSEELKETKIQANRTAQIVHQLIRSPLASNYKVNYLIRSLIREELPSVPKSSSHTRSSGVALYLIHRFIKTFGGELLTGKPKNMIPIRANIDKINLWVSMCTKLNSGTFGYYSHPQKWTTSGYRGLGIWVGVMEGINVKLTVDTSARTEDSQVYLMEVQVDNPTEFLRCLPTLREWCKDHHVTIPTELSTGNRHAGLTAYKIGTSFTMCPLSSKTTPVCTPPRGTKTMELARLLDGSHLSIQVTEQVCRVVMVRKDPSYGLPVTLLSLSCSSLDHCLTQIDPSTLRGIDSSLYQYWVARQPLPLSKANQLLREVVEKEQECYGSKSRGELINWLSENFWSTCIRMGLTGEKFKTSLQETLDYDVDEMDYYRQKMLASDLHVDFQSLFTSYLAVSEEEHRVMDWSEEDGGATGNQPAEWGEDPFDEIFESLFDEDIVNIDRAPYGGEMRYQLIKKPLLDTWMKMRFPTVSFGNSVAMYLNRKICQRNLEDELEVLNLLSGFDCNSIMLTDSLLAEANSSAESADLFIPLEDLEEDYLNQPT